VTITMTSHMLPIEETPEGYNPSIQAWVEWHHDGDVLVMTKLCAALHCFCCSGWDVEASIVAGADYTHELHELCEALDLFMSTPQHTHGVWQELIQGNALAQAVELATTLGVP
jgi:hypothetical protein